MNLSLLIRPLYVAVFGLRFMWSDSLQTSHTASHQNACYLLGIDSSYQESLFLSLSPSEKQTLHSLYITLQGSFLFISKANISGM